MKKIIMVAVILLLAAGCNSKNKTIEEEYGEQNSEIKETLKDIKVGEDQLEIFKDLMIVNDNTLETEFGITPDEVENYIAAVPTIVDTRLYIIIKPKEGKEEVIKKAIKNYLTNYEQRLEMSGLSEEELAAKKEKLDNRLEEEVNGYYIYIVSDDNQTIFNAIEEQIKAI